MGALLRVRQTETDRDRDRHAHTHTHTHTGREVGEGKRPGEREFRPCSVWDSQTGMKQGGLQTWGPTDTGSNPGAA